MSIFYQIEFAKLMICHPLLAHFLLLYLLAR